MSGRVGEQVGDGVPVELRTSHGLMDRWFGGWAYVEVGGLTGRLIGELTIWRDGADG